MTQAELGSCFIRKQRKRRIIEAVILVIAAALAVVFHHLWKASEVIVYHEPVFSLPNSKAWESTERNDVFLFLSVTCTVASCLFGAFLISDLLFCRFQTIVKGEQFLTVYRGLFHCSVYVDGVEKARLGPIAFTNVAEVWLKDRVRATVSFSTTIWYLAHISFSDYTTSMEI